MDKIVFNFNEHKNEKEVVRCRTIEEAIQWCQHMYDNGLKWRSGRSYLNHINYSIYNYWNTYKEDTCYYFNEGYVGVVQYAVRDGYTVIEFSSLLNSKRVKL